MRKIIFNNKDSLIKGLRNFGGAIVLLTYLSSGVNEVITIRESAKNIINADDSFISDFPLLKEGKYSVEAVGEDCEIEYKSHALAITFEAKLKNSLQDIKVGNFSKLKKALSDYKPLEIIGNAKDTSGLVRELITKILDEESGLIENGNYPAGYYWVPIPYKPVNLNNLKNTLSKEAVYYAFPNGKGTIDKYNLHQGDGLLTLYS